MAASFTKLNNGDWGIRVTGTVSEGAKVTVKKKDGTESTETVEKVVWTDGKASICAIKKKQSTGGRRRGGYNSGADRGGHEGYCGFPCPVTGRTCNPSNGPCHDCQ